jgi:Ca2+-binding RTX toxin-like protein
VRLRVLLVLVVLGILALPAGTGSAVGMCGGMAATRWGTAGADVIYGTSGPDVIQGFGGDDVIYGQGGADRLCGGRGDDFIYGGDGTNLLWGNGGNDVLVGGPHFDTIYGGRGRDVLDAGGWRVNHLYGQGGRDRIVLRQVEPGDDQLADGGPGRDKLDLRQVNVPLGGARGVFVALEQLPPNMVPVDCWSDSPGSHNCWVTWDGVSSVSGIEIIFGSPGGDWLNGDAQSNRLVGGPGADSLEWLGGNDYLDGGPGHDVGDGGEGWDTCDGIESYFSCESFVYGF